MTIFPKIFWGGMTSLPPLGNFLGTPLVASMISESQTASTYDCLLHLQQVLTHLEKSPAVMLCSVE